MKGLESGRGIPVVKPGSAHRLELDEEALSSLLLREDIRDRAVVVLSVAGAFRKGKSFLLDFLLRYLHHKYNSNSDYNFLVEDDWLGDEDEPLKGFHWRGGANRDTSGILLWSQPFKATLPSGDKVAILLMDTQGIFDDDTTVRENMTVFALSTMVSSVQVYNLSQNLKEDDLQHLEFFTEYGRVAQKKSSNTGKPFQRLQFLVRDWQVPYEMSYGAEGGRKLLDRRLKPCKGQHEELKTVRNHIAECFEQLECFLMPYPGADVATNPDFNGNLRVIDPVFIASLRELVPMLLAPENLVVKRIEGQKVKVKDLRHYFKAYMDALNNKEMPQATTILEATAQGNNQTLVFEALEVYEGHMEEVCGANRPYVETSQLELEHEVGKRAALAHFGSKTQFGGEALSQPFLKQLLKLILVRLKKLRAFNDSKRTFLNKLTAILTNPYVAVPAVIAVIGIACVVVPGFAIVVSVFVRMITFFVG